MAGILQLGRRFLEHARDRWVRGNHAVVVHDPDAKGTIKVDRRPRHGHTRRVDVPRFGGRNRLHQELEPGNGARHRSEHGEDELGARSAAHPAEHGDAAERRLEAVSTAHRARDAARSGDIASDADGRSESGRKHGFATGRPPCRPRAVVRVLAAAPDIVDRVGRHERHRNVALDEDDGALTLEGLDDGGIVLPDVIEHGSEPDGSPDTFQLVLICDTSCQ